MLSSSTLLHSGLAMDRGKGVSGPLGIGLALPLVITTIYTNALLVLNDKCNHLPDERNKLNLSYMDDVTYA